MLIELAPDVALDLTASPYDTEGLSCCILGNKGSGKSNLMGVMAEEAHRNTVPFIYFDPNGDAAALRELGDDVIVIGDQRHDEPIRRAHYPLDLVLAEARDFIRMVLTEGFSLVIDLTEGDDPELSQTAFQCLVNEHYRQAGKLRSPCFVFVDEAHQFAPQSGANKLEKLSLRALGKVASDGRKRGMMLVVASQRATYLSKRIVFGVNVRVFGKITYWPDYDAIKHYLPINFKQMRNLRSGEVFLVTSNEDGYGKRLGKVQIKRRSTPDLGATPVIKPRRKQPRPSIKQLQLL